MALGISLNRYINTYNSRGLESTIIYTVYTYMYNVSIWNLYVYYYCYEFDEINPMISHRYMKYISYLHIYIYTVHIIY